MIAMTRRTQKATSADVIDAFGDRQICDRCGASISSYGDVCKAALDERCEGFETYDRLLMNTQALMDGEWP